MNKAEISEIKKQFTPDLCTIDRICACYVNHEKKKVFTIREAFPLIPDEEMFKYLDVFRHVLSGTRGRNLVDIAFPLESTQPGGAQDFLYQLRESGLQDDILTDMFYDRVIESFDYGENYYIILVYASMDVPLVTSDGAVNEDASETVYEYLLCAICPVVLSKAALSYDEEKNLIVDRFRDWIVDMPVKGFLFPAFHDRAADIHHLLYYTKKPEDLQPAFVELMFGAPGHLSATTQNEGFKHILREVLGEDGEYETVRRVHETLNRMIEEHDDTEEALTFNKKQVKELLLNSGIREEQLSGLNKEFKRAFGEGDTKLLATNLANTNRFECKTPDVRILVNPECIDLVKTKVVDGRKCLVIAIDDRVEVNGVQVRA